ncbi:hypothetical protein RHGRI_012090 [Rhododendron griersonianum]|uniref:RNase H type-1 domain-containing protein n=1 Tax=Rhododendron griersonianum TaxID=479676 RepID=A0AAV6KP75_9ERIC|nr:hypothetical protein RHGRI_012090 [Rhododendron griersonianum]
MVVVMVLWRRWNALQLTKFLGLNSLTVDGDSQQLIQILGSLWKWKVSSKIFVESLSMGLGVRSDPVLLLDLWYELDLAHGLAPAMPQYRAQAHPTFLPAAHDLAHMLYSAHMLCALGCSFGRPNISQFGPLH